MTKKHTVLTFALCALFAGCDGRTCDDCVEPDAGAPPGTDAGAPTAGCEGVDLVADGVLDIALSTVRVSGRLTFDGAAPGELATLAFQRADQRAFREVVVEPDGAFAARFVPGVYEVHYVAGAATCVEGLPCSGGVLREEVSILADGVLDLDVDVVHVSGALTLEGEPWPAGALGSITFRRGDHSAAVAVDESTGAFDLALLPGTYDVIYASTTSFCGGPAPCGGGVLREALSIETDGSLSLDVEAVRITGALTVAGAASTSFGRAVLSSAEGVTDLGILADGSFDVVIVPGTYDVVYQPLGECSTDAPCIAGTAREAIALTRDGVLDVDVPSVTVTGVVRLDGGTIPDAAQRGFALFESEGGAALAPLSATGEATYALALLPGTYDVGFSGYLVDCAGPLPCNTGVLRDAVDLGADGSLDLDVRAVSVSGVVRVDGAPTAAATVRVDGALGASTLPVAVDGSYAAVLLAGTYDLHVVPRDPFACDPFCGSALARDDVSLEADGVLDLAVETAAVTGRVTIDGVPSDAGQVALTNVGEATGGAGVPVETDGAYAARVPHGRYVVGWTTFCEDEALCGTVSALGCE